ncbi:MAG: hypothetical protein IMZ55_11960, partial [Acidobacteria bacterium]|nr:hypothetical protein [Acidobacteriota bacterium]
MRRWRWLLVLLCACTRAAPALAAQDLALPGGVAGLSKALGIELPVPRARVMLEAIRITHPFAYGVRPDVSERQDRLSTYFFVLRQFQNAWAALPLSDGRISLKVAENKQGRQRLQDVLDVIGLKLREQKRVYAIERTTDRRAESRRQWLGLAGVDLETFEKDLAAGRPASVAVPVARVPLPLSADVWRSSVFERQVPAHDLCGAILSDRAAALVYHGLAGLDPVTLAFLAGDSETLGRLYRDHAAVFATMGRAIRVRDGRVQVPGGATAERLWERLVGEPVTQPGRFLRRVVSADDGRLALFYDTLAHLNPPGQRFALGALIGDRGQRDEHWRALYDAFSVPLNAWTPGQRPFIRVAFDATQLFTELTVTEDGALGAPAWYSLWDAAFRELTLPDDPARELGSTRGGPLIAAAPLVARVSVADPVLRRERTEAVLFAQRVFGSAPESAAPEILVALRGFVRYRALMLTLERIGVSDPAIYAKAARYAAGLSAIGNPALAATTTVEFQGAMALIERARFRRALDLDAAGGLVVSLLNVPPSREGYFAGQIARWLDGQFLPALAAATGTAPTAANRERVILLALAGATGGEPAAVKTVSSPVIQWEEQTYRLDLAAPELARLEQARERQAGNSLDPVLEYARHAAALAAGAATVDQARSAAAALEQAVAALKQPQRVGLVYRDPIPDLAAVTQKALREVRKLKNPRDLRKLPDIAWPLVEMSDTMLAEVLPSLVYAASLGDPDGAVLAAGNPALGHDLGLLVNHEELRLRAPWSMPVEQAGPGVPWHITGSLLGLDVGLASLARKQIASDRMPLAPRLDDNELRAFNEAIVLTNAHELTDRDRDATLAGITKGRQRVLSAIHDPGAIDQLMADPRIDEWRARALPWLAREEPDRIPEWFSLAELFWLGSEASLPGA